jgi:hypothetical protein
LKLKINADLTEGIVYEVLIDFDAAKSILQTGNFTYKLKPVIRTITSAGSGAIKGTIFPLESSPSVFAIIGSDTIATTYAADDGQFLLRGLPEGNYIVSFNPKEGFLPIQQTNVIVTIGLVTDLGKVSMQ